MKDTLAITKKPHRNALATTPLVLNTVIFYSVKKSHFQGPKYQRDTSDRLPSNHLEHLSNHIALSWKPHSNTMATTHKTLFLHVYIILYAIFEF